MTEFEQFMNIIGGEGSEESTYEERVPTEEEIEDGVGEDYSEESEFDDLMKIISGEDDKEKATEEQDEDLDEEYEDDEESDNEEESEEEIEPEIIDLMDSEDAENIVIKLGEDSELSLSDIKNMMETRETSEALKEVFQESNDTLSEKLAEVEQLTLEDSMSLNNYLNSTNPAQLKMEYEIALRAGDQGLALQKSQELMNYQNAVTGMDALKERVQTLKETKAQLKQQQDVQAKALAAQELSKTWRKEYGETWTPNRINDALDFAKEELGMSEEGASAFMTAKGIRILKDMQKFKNTEKLKQEKVKSRISKPAKKSVGKGKRVTEKKKNSGVGYMNEAQEFEFFSKMIG